MKDEIKRNEFNLEMVNIPKELMNDFHGYTMLLAKYLKEKNTGIDVVICSVSTNLLEWSNYEVKIFQNNVLLRKECGE